jgi:hypothetical protein
MPQRAPFIIVEIPSPRGVSSVRFTRAVTRDHAGRITSVSPAAHDRPGEDLGDIRRTIDREAPIEWQTSRMTLSPDLVVRYGDHIAFVIEESQVVAANLLTSEVHILSGTGASIWECIDAESSIASVVDAVSDAYPDGDPDRMAPQIAAYLEDLGDAGLVEFIERQVRV